MDSELYRRLGEARLVSQVDRRAHVAAARRRAFGGVLLAAGTRLEGE